MNKHRKRNLGKTLTTLSLIGFTAGVGWAEQQVIPFTPQTNSLGLCPGTWTGYAKMTNTTDGTAWVVPPTNVVSGTLTDASGFAAPYVSIANVQSKFHISQKWCDTNTVTFPATNTDKYALTVYVKSPLPPPTNGQPMNLQITWQTNQ